jgi:hypothetical protein
MDLSAQRRTRRDCTGVRAYLGKVGIRVFEPEIFGGGGSRNMNAC